MKEKVVGLISGGIDSPVASLVASRRFKVIPLHFCLYPLCSKEDTEKTMKILRKLYEKIDFDKAIIHPWAGILKEIINRVKESHTCLVCRKSMLLTANEICKSEGAQGIVTGESLGQKASQTLENLIAISQNLDVPVLRPVLGMNKQEIIDTSKDLGIWRADHSERCPGIPQNPRTKASIEEVEREIEKINLKELMKENEDLTLDLKKFDQEFDNYLLKLSEELGDTKLNDL